MKFKLFLLTIFLFQQACSSEDIKKNQTIIPTESKIVHHTLFYSGIIQPLKTIVIPSPADGVVLDMPFQYGEVVQSGRLLFTLSSTKFLTDYKAALTQYVKAKNEFNTSKSQLSEAEFLHKHLLISDDDFKMKQSNFYSNRLALLQAKDALEGLTDQAAIQDIDFDRLTIVDFDNIIEAMHLNKHSENLRVLAPTTGLILFSNRNEDESKKIVKGDAVKQGDVLAIIGDMNGITVHIKVNELTVNQLQSGQLVKVTGLAFPDDILIGEIKRIDHQGEGANGGLPFFSVEVVVPKLTKEQQQRIHVGMSAKVEIDIKEESRIMVPIAAINEKNNMSTVRLYNEKSKTLQEVAVKTGITTAQSVVILSGLKPGDKIAIPY
ncbi:MAG: hypothetical protein A3F42_08630 [Gammaproteobacteria bacterium RIFCSPHIGHO2_12_FULL_37_34]|nr:MAG: hypothetical protein A3F42_08630 [Gammaproteobacteria bacterium RIFCSPHIGHO2_12_FULL_37_34]